MAVDRRSLRDLRPVRLLAIAELEWTVDSAGNATEVIISSGGNIVSGELWQVRVLPRTPTPTDLYDITIEDNDISDLLEGQGTDMSNSSVNVIQVITPVTIGANTFYVRPIFRTPLAINITNAGNLTSGTVICYFK